MTTRKTPAKKTSHHPAKAFTHKKAAPAKKAPTKAELAALKKRSQAAKKAHDSKKK